MANGQIFIPVEKTETRKGGMFEDVRRPSLQMTLHGGYRFGQIILLLMAAFAWAKVAEAYDPERVSGRFADLLSGAIWFITLVAIGAAVVFIYRHVETDRGWTVLILSALLLIWIGFNLLVAPVITFALVMIQSNLLYVIPVLITAAAASFVPSFEVGRYSFWRELVDQSGANSEKAVIDETALELERMKQDFAREQANGREEQFKAEIERLRAMLRTPQMIDPEPTFRGKSIEECIRAIKVNGHWEYQSMTRNGPRRLDETLLMQFVIEAWGQNQFKRRYWLERGLKRDDWEAMMGAIAWALDDQGNVIRGVDDVIAELMRFGVLTPAVYPTPPVENSVSRSRP